jgi:catechol 2,3-dioxygenase-like lactoylglutathione lyase family enzyme
MLKLTHAVVDIAITCSHFEESLHFYRDLLGLEVTLDIEIPDDVAVGAGLAPRGFRQVRLKAGETLIKLMADLFCGGCV